MIRVVARTFVAGLLLAASLPPWGWWPLAFVGLAMLDRLMHGQALDPAQRAIRVPPLGIVDRASTDMVALPDLEVARALRYIALNCAHAAACVSRIADCSKPRFTWMTVALKVPIMIAMTATIARTSKSK